MSLFTSKQWLDRGESCFYYTNHRPDYLPDWPFFFSTRKLDSVDGTISEQEVLFCGPWRAFFERQLEGPHPGASSCLEQVTFPLLARLTLCIECLFSFIEQHFKRHTTRQNSPLPPVCRSQVCDWRELRRGVQLRYF